MDEHERKSRAEIAGLKAQIAYLAANSMRVTLATFERVTLALVGCEAELEEYIRLGKKGA